MTADRFELVTLTEVDDDPALLRTVFDDVFRPSFDHAELPGWDDMVAGIGGPGGDEVYVALLDGSVAGAALSGAPLATDVTLLSYLAARPGGRSRGVGSFLMGHLRARWSDGGACLVLAEVHDPRFHETTEDERPADRLAFYDRCGAAIVAPWIQPALVPGGDRVEGMLLLSFAVPARPVPDDLLVRWADGYYLLAEGDVPEDDALRELRRRLRDTDPTTTIPIDELARLTPLAYP